MGQKQKTFSIKADKLLVTPTDISDIWECDWDITMKDDGEKIGTFSFAGEKELGTIPVQISIPDVTKRNLGYGTEVLKAMKDWAFYHRDIYELTATVEHENSGAIIALEKAGFVFREGTREIEQYSVTKQKTSWMGLYFSIGIVIGLILAAVTTITWMSIIPSVAVCLAVGAGMDAKENAHRREVTGKSFSDRKKK